MYLEVKWYDSGNLFKNTEKMMKGERNVIDKNKNNKIK